MKTDKSIYKTQVGQRLQLARKMADISSVAKLIENEHEWQGRDSTLSNYEAGISLAPPEAALFYQMKTRCSACWIYFGSGPIRTDGRDEQAIRHQNLVAIFEDAREEKQIKAFLSALGLSRPKLDNYINNPFKEIPDKLARKAENFSKRKKGWIDEQHIENDPVCQSFPDDLKEIMHVYSSLDDDKKTLLLKVIRSFE